MERDLPFGYEQRVYVCALNFNRPHEITKTPEPKSIVQLLQMLVEDKDLVCVHCNIQLHVDRVRRFLYSSHFVVVEQCV